MIVKFLARLRARMTEPAASAPSIQVSRLEAARTSLSNTTDLQALVASSRHWDGYIRQAALERLANIESTETLKVALARQNDWVEPIRKLARTIAFSYLVPERTSYVLANLAEIRALVDKRRDDHASFLREVRKLVAEPDVQSLLTDQFLTLSPATARFVFGYMQTWQGDRVLAAIRRAACHDDCLLRLSVVQACVARAPYLEPLLWDLLADNHPRVRQAALRALWEMAVEPGSRATLLRSALLDPSASLRELAIWYAKADRFPLASFADELLAAHESGTPISVGLIGFLGLLGDRRHLEIVEEAARDKFASVRLVAMTAKVRLGDSKNDIVLRAMRDPCGKVFSFGLRLASDNEVTLDTRTYRGLMNQLLEQGQLNRVLRMSGIMPTWDRLEVLLALAKRELNTEEARRLDAAIRQWLRDKTRSFIPVPAIQRQVLTDLLNELCKDEPAPEWRWLSSVRAHVSA